MRALRWVAAGVALLAACWSGVLLGHWSNSLWLRKHLAAGHELVLNDDGLVEARWFGKSGPMVRDVRPDARVR